MVVDLRVLMRAADFVLSSSLYSAINRDSHPKKTLFASAL